MTMKYERPTIRIVEVKAELLSSSDIGGPCATDIGEPSFDSKSIWDAEETQYNNKEEQDYEDWI